MKWSAAVETWKERLLTTPQAPPDDRTRIRAVLDSLILHLHPTRVPVRALRFAYTWGLGGISATLVLVLVATGVLLMFRYEPNVERAYISIQRLEAQVAFGSLFRAAHHWSAHLLVITTFLHLLRVFLTGGYKRGRFANWLIGIALMLLVLAFNFTGLLLPWDQLAYWAITVSTSLISYIPIIGPLLSRFLVAGTEVGQGALSNFYALHVAVLPALLIVVLSYHFWRVRKDGGISQPDRKPGERVKHVTTIPHLVRIEFAVAMVVIAGLMIWSMLVPAPLQALADPTRSPNPAKAVWFLVGLQELLLHMHTLAAIVLVAGVMLAVGLLPRWDRQEDNIGIYFRSPVGRQATVMGALLSVNLVPLMVVADEFWIDLHGWLLGWPALVSSGLIPLLTVVAVFAGVYAIARKGLRANHSEALMGLFTFIITSLIVLTVIGNLFRGPNMALRLPF